LKLLARATMAPTLAGLTAALALALQLPPAATAPHHRHLPAQDADGLDPLDYKGNLPDLIRHSAGRSGLPKRWKEGTFEIHMFEIGQGNSQLIVFPSGYSILLDVAENSWNTRRGAERVAANVKAVPAPGEYDLSLSADLHLNVLGNSCNRMCL
jgi:hypothetical protein